MDVFTIGHWWQLSASGHVILPLAPVARVWTPGCCVPPAVATQWSHILHSRASMVVTTSHIHRLTQTENVSDIYTLVVHHYVIIYITYSFMFFIATQTAQTQAE